MPRWPALALSLILCSFTAPGALASGGAAAASLAPPAPTSSLDALRDTQQRVQKLIADNAPATVCLLIGGATGSGVIVDEDGLILTAAHVSGRPGRQVVVLFPDGSRAQGKTLGQNTRQDAGMAQITDDPPDDGWPHAELADDDTLETQQYIVALGHPGGYDQARPFVARLGRVQSLGWGGITSSCILIAGDSGGPLFDLDGKLVGIHSRIGLSTAQNVHVPVKTFRDGWDRMVANEVWNQWRLPADPDAPFLGVAGRNTRRGVQVMTVVPGSAAAEAGVQLNDVITAIDGRPIEDQAQLIDHVNELKIGQSVDVLVLRDERPQTLKVTITKREDADAQ